MPESDETTSEGPQSALPPVGARVLAVVSIVVAGACGGLIGYAVVDLQCRGDCGSPRAIGGLVGALTAALGVAIVAVLVLRAMGEWRTIEHGRAAQRDYVNQAEDGRGPRMTYRVAEARAQREAAAALAKPEPPEALGEPEAGA